MDDQLERRKNLRRNVRWPVRIFTGNDTVEGETVDISIEGISICIEEAVRLDEIIRISLEPEDHNIMEVSGRITWSDLYGIDDENRTIGMGVCFVEISDPDRRFLDEMISAAPET